MKPKFELKADQTVKENILRIMDEQYDNIISYCNHYDKNADKAVHEIRKSFKRLRAVLRLIRDEIGYSTYYRENAFYRDEAKLISELRDLKVFHEDLEALAKKHKQTIDYELIELLQQAIIEEKNEKFNKKLSENIFQTIINDVTEARARLHAFSFAKENFACIAPGLNRIYKQGRKELQIVKKSPTTENYHNLRKRVKYLMYHCSILQPVWERYFKAIGKVLDDAADQLGLDHNYAELICYLNTFNNQSVDADRKANFTKWLEKQRKTLQDPALNNIEKIYVETPGEFMARIRKYYELSNFPK